MVSGLVMLFLVLTLVFPHSAVATAATEVSVNFQPAAAQSEPLGADRLLERVVSGQLAALDTSELEEFINGLDREIQAYIPALDLNKIILRDGGRIQVDFPRLARGLIQYFMREVVFNFRLLGQLLLLIILCAALYQLQISWNGLPNADLVVVVSFLVMLFIALECFQSALGVASDAMEKMVDFMQAIVPTLSALLVAAGAVTSAAVLHPMLLVTVVLVGTAIRHIVFPLSLVSLVLGIVGNLSSQMTGSRLAGLANKAAVFVLSLLCIAFLGVVTVRGALVPLVDGVGLKTAKFLAGKFVPVVGGVFSGAVEVVAGGSVLIKSAIGAFGLFVVIVLAAFPLVKLGSILFIFRLIGALVEPITDLRIVKALDQIGNSLALVFASVAVTAVMFFLALTIVVSVGNVSVMVQ